MKILVNNEIRDMTNAEVSQFNSDATVYVSKVTAEKNEATAKASAKASGNTKLLGLGLTQTEATALTGYTPE